MAKPLVRDRDNIRLAMLGMVEGNGHPYSWSAIVNGTYNASEIIAGGYGGIVDYLKIQPPGALGIAGAKVTHVWCDNRADADQVVRASGVAHAVDRAEDVIGQVDAVIVATDKGHEHVDRARPFIEAGLPVFIDKPLTDRADHLQQFIDWQRQGKAFMSTSAMRYAREYLDLKARLNEVGQPRLIIGNMLKDWERYGIHALEAVYQLLEPGGWQWLTNSGDEKTSIVHIHHRSGVDVVLNVIKDMIGGYGIVGIYGTTGYVQTKLSDTFNAFKSQLVTYIDYLRSGELPFSFDQTVEQMKIIIAGILSKEQGGRRIEIDSVL